MIAFSPQGNFTSHFDTFALSRKTTELPDGGLFRKVLSGLCCRRYEECAERVLEAFGPSALSVSRWFIRAFVQSASENESVCATFLRDLADRGLEFQDGLLVVLDGAKGLRKLVRSVFGFQSLMQRRQWHKREDVLRYLSKSQQAPWRRKLPAANERPTYAEAKAALLRVRRELAAINQSAVPSLEEWAEETLTLNRLDLFGVLGVSLKTTKCLESIMAPFDRRTNRMAFWRSSDQKQRRVAAALMDIEPRLRRTKGYRHLLFLRSTLNKRAELSRESVKMWHDINEKWD